MAILDGKQLSQVILKELQEIITAQNLKPCLAIILVGEDPASVAYVNQKQKRGEEIGVEVLVYRFPVGVGEKAIEGEIAHLNADPRIHGVILQLPLPGGLDKDKLLNQINVSKDVDGLAQGSLFKPATPLGVMQLLERNNIQIGGKQAVVVGQSVLVGKPVASMLAEAGAKVSTVDINTKNPAKIIKGADILVVAVGKPHFIKKEVLKKGVVVVDVGITRTEKGLVGDVDFDDVKEVVSYITPVPGGVGPMTVAMLLANVVQAAKQSKH